MRAGAWLARALVAAIGLVFGLCTPTLAEPHVIWPAELVRLVIDTAIAERRFGLARAVAMAVLSSLPAVVPNP